MEMYIEYDDERKFDGFFWEEFFKSIGIAVNHKKKESSYNILLLDENSPTRTNYKDKVYFVRERKRKDAFGNTINDNKYYLEELENIGNKLGISDKVMDEWKFLLEVFTKYRIAYIIWIYQGLPEYRSAFKDELMGSIQAAIEDIGGNSVKKNNTLLYTKFFYYELRLLQIYFQDQSTDVAGENVNELSHDIQSFFCMEKFKDFHTRCLELGSEACLISPSDHKYSVMYYLGLIKKGYNISENYFKMGRAYDYFYVDKEKAIKFYRKSLEINPNNFKANYFLGANTFLKFSGDYIRFNQVYRLLEGQMNDPNDWLKLDYAEYYFKSLKRYMFFLKNFTTFSDDDFFEENVSKKIEILNKSEPFSNIFDAMAIDGVRNLEQEKKIQNISKRKILSCTSTHSK